MVIYYVVEYNVVVKIKVENLNIEVIIVEIVNFDYYLHFKCVLNFTLVLIVLKIDINEENLSNS